MATIRLATIGSYHPRQTKNMNKTRYFLPILLIAFTPLTASANAGTPLMWASGLHMVFGNLFIGIFEGLLLSWFFKISKWKSILILIGANYTSAWVGSFLLSGSFASLPDITIQNIQAWLLFFVVVAFAVTLLVEFPFFWFALRSRERAFGKALKATPVIHGISYALLFGWYWMASGTSMVTQLEVVPPSALQPEGNYVIYYLSPEGDQVLKLGLNDESKPVAISKVPASRRSDRLLVCHNGDSGYELFIFVGSDRENGKIKLLARESLAEQDQVDRQSSEGSSEKTQDEWFYNESVTSLADNSDWKFSTGHWAADGIYGKNVKTNRTVQFALETPFAAWLAYNATHLQGDFVIFQLGDDQICILHPESKRIALLARGKGPVVAKHPISKKAVQEATPNPLPRL